MRLSAWVLACASGCFGGGSGALEEAPCSAEMETSGEVELAWGPDTAVVCSGFGPSSDDTIDLYWEEGFDSLRVRLDFVLLGETGVFDDPFVGFEHEDDQWGSYGDLPCAVTLDRSEDIGKGQLGTRVWALAGSVTCEGALQPFQSEGTVDIGTVQFEGRLEEFPDDL